MKIYTKTGDSGKTSLLSGTRVAKHHLRIEAYGTIDELNSHIGLLRAYLKTQEETNTLIHIQDRLFVAGSLLAQDVQGNPFNLSLIQQTDIEMLEKEMDRMESLLPPLNNFVLPGGHEWVASIHIARTVCRRAERLVVAMAEEYEIDSLIVVYLNRLSDYLFMLSRFVAKLINLEEVTWPLKK